MIWGIVISASVGIIAIIVAVIFGLKSLKSKKPACAHKTTKIIGVGTDAPSELELLFNKRPVDEVHRTTFIFFNMGAQAIRKDDVTEDIAILFRGAEILRVPTIKARNKEPNKLVAKSVVNTEGQHLVQLDFLYLDHEDGAVVEVLHTPSEQISCEGNIIEAKAVANLGEFEEARPWPVLNRSIMTLVLAAAFVGLGLFWWFRISPSSPEMGLAFAVVLSAGVSVALGLFIGFLVSGLPQYLRCRKFPSWARGTMTEEASNLAAKGIPLEAFCFSCRTKKTIKHPQFVTLKNGRPAVRGVCPDCGAKVFRIGQT